MANWIQISSTLGAKHTEALEDALLAAGASAVTMMDAADQAILEPSLGSTPVWDNTTVIGLFDAEEDIEHALRITHEVFELQTNESCELRTELLENEDWTRKWIENFKPIQFGSRLWVCPSWCEIPDKNAVNLILDPGLAFGTGTHPTTALCLEWLGDQNLEGKTVLDYGCGSGILGIAAALLGAQKVYAVDNDPQALIATRDNSKRNQLNESLIETLLPEEVHDIKADILVANILAEPLMQLKDQMLKLVKPNTPFALSGILRGQIEELSNCYSESANHIDKSYLEDWARLDGTLI